MLAASTFLAFTAFVAGYSWFRLRKENLKSRDGYFLGGRSLSGIVIAGSMLLTNLSTEHLIGMNGSAYKNGVIVMAWEVTSAFALVFGALYFIPKYLKMGLTTIPEYLEQRFDPATRSLVASLLLISFAVTLLPIVLYTGAINLESIFDISNVLGVSYKQGLWLTVVAIGAIGSVYAIFGGLKAVAISDTVNAYGLLIGGIAIPVLAFFSIGDGNLFSGVSRVYHFSPEKFNPIGSHDSILPFEVLFTGLMINQIYFWCMNQTIIQRSFGAKSLAEAQKGLLYTGLLKTLVPLIIVIPGVIGFYYFGDSLYEKQDLVYPMLVKKVLPPGFSGIFAAVVMGAVLSTFNSVLNSAATIFSIDIFQRHIDKEASDLRLVRSGKTVSVILAVTAIIVAPFIANAPEGLYQLMQQLNGIFFIPIASIMLAGFFTRKISAAGAKAALISGMLLYILSTFILKLKIHFVHIWGIEFVINMLIMYVVSYFIPNQKTNALHEGKHVTLITWKYANHFAVGLCLFAVGIYIFLAVIS